MDLPTTSYRTGSFLPGSNRGDKLTLAQEESEPSRSAQNKSGDKWNSYQENGVTSKARGDGRGIRSICRFVLLR
jgi:hypothetical protein